MARRNKISRDAVRRDGSPDNGITGLGNTATNVTGAASAGGVAVTASRTDHTHQGVHSILPATNSGLTVTPTTGLGDVVIDNATSGANWTIANPRIYAIDFVNGLDTNQGFADAASNSAGDYATACALAGTRARKTIAGLAAIFPRIGNGRIVEVVIRNGGVNTEQAYTDSLAILLNGVYGYAGNGCLIRGTGTNTTAGAVAFAGTTADVDYQGAITSTGCNAAGYNPTGAPTTTVVQCLKVGGGAAAIPVEPAEPLGYRMRYDSATTTAALRNVCRQVHMVAGTDTLSLATALPAVPVAADIFYLEKPGISYPTSSLVGIYGGGSNFQLTGLRCSGTLAESACNVRHAFCGANAFNALGLGSIINAQTFVHSVLSTRTVGGGMRSDTTYSVSQLPGNCSLNQTVSAGLTTLTQLSNFVWGTGSYAGAGLNALSCNSAAGLSSTNAKSLGITIGPVGLPRVNGGALQLIGCTILMGALQVTNAGAVPAINLRGGGNILVIDGIVSGATGNTLSGLGFVVGSGNLVVLLQTPTITGVIDLGLAQNIAVTWAQIAATGITDNAGNRIIGPTAGSGAAQGMDTKSGVVLSDLAGAVFTYIADENPTSLGALVVINNIVPVRWATSLRLMTRLRACYLQPAPSTQPLVITLYKNNVATAMTVTIPNGSAVGFKIADVAHPILFLDGDDWAIRIDCPQAGAEGPTAYAVGVTAEWAV